MTMTDTRTGSAPYPWSLANAALDKLTGTLDDDQRRDLNHDLADDHRIEKHTPATFYQLASRGCPHGLPDKLRTAEDAYDFDPDKWLECTGIADEHFWDEDGDLYCRALPAAEAGCEECETLPCMLPERRQEAREDLWHLVSRERQQYLAHEAGEHHARHDPHACASCDVDAWAASHELNLPRKDT